MIYKPRHFTLEELACPHVFKKYGATAWQFFSQDALITLDLLRDLLGPIYVNNWDMDEADRKSRGLPLFDERGFRCLHCSLVRDAIREDRLYVSPHMTGQGFDFDVKGMNAAQVRLWIMKNDIKLPNPIRLEKNVNWVHLDVRDAGKGKVFLFNN
jgi:hypothetical protein